MKTRRNVQKTVELGVGLTAVAALVLAGCGGGSGTVAGTTATAGSTTSTTIVPFKGAYSSGTVTLFDAMHKQVGGGAINASGVCNCSYTTGAQFPLIVEVTGTYLNEISGKAESSVKPLRSMISDTNTAGSASGVPVTPVTELAVALTEKKVGSFSALAAAIQPASAVSAFDQAEQTLGLPAGTAKQVPLDGAGNEVLANTGTLKDVVSKASVFSNGDLATAVNAFAQAVANLPAASAVSNLIPAASQAAVTTNLAAINKGRPAANQITALALPATTAQQIQSQVAANNATMAANSAAADSFLADASSANGLRRLVPGSPGMPAFGSPSTNAFGHKLLATLSNGIYSAAFSVMELINKVWSTPANQWVTYVLSPTAGAGFVDKQTLGVSLSKNANGTVTVTDAFGSWDAVVQAVTLDGATFASGVLSPITNYVFSSGVAQASGIISGVGVGSLARLDANAWNNPASAVNPAGSYPAGSTLYNLIPVSAYRPDPAKLVTVGASGVQLYTQVGTGTQAQSSSNLALDVNGKVAASKLNLAALAAYSSSVNPLCVGGQAWVANPASSTATAAVFNANYNQAWSASGVTCAASSVSANALYGWTVTLTQTTLNGNTLLSANTSGVFAPQQQSYLANIGGNVVMVYPAASQSGLVNSYPQAGTAQANPQLNTTAANAALKALGLPNL